MIAVLTTYFLTIAGRRWGLSVPESILFSLLSLVGTQAITYARFGTPETTTTLFISIALLAATPTATWTCRRSATFFFAVALASLNKETALLCVPALTIVWAIAREKSLPRIKVRQILKPVVAANLAATTCLIYVARYVKGPGYASFSGSQAKPDRVIIDLFGGELRWLTFLASLGALVSLLSRAKVDQPARVHSQILWVAAFLGFLIPQAVMYGNSSFSGHYGLPASICLAAVASSALRSVRRSQKLILSCAVWCVTFLISAVQIVAGLNYMSETARTSKGSGALFSALGECSTPGSDVFVVGSPIVDYEQLHAIAVVGRSVAPESSFHLVEIGGSSSAAIVDQKTAEVERRLTFLNPDPIRKEFDSSIELGTRLSWPDAVVILRSSLAQNPLRRQLLTDGELWENFRIVEFRNLDIALACESVGAGS
jgi:hypothetical protein